MSVSVTIGTCVRNSERTIKQSIESIVIQKYPMDLLQLIVVDGCSKDKTLSIINYVASKAGVKVEIYSDKGEGLGAARQIVVDNAKGKYVIFVDSDVRLFSNFVRNHVNFMEKNPDVAAAFGKLVLQKGRLTATVWDLADYAQGGSVGIGATIYRSEVLRHIGGFDTKIKGAAEDKDLTVRFRLHGYRSSANGTARFFHERRENLRSFWVEQSWFGYGDHYFNHKHRDTSAVWRKFPAGEFVWGLKLASKAYERSRRKLSFLILPQMLFGNIGWWTGFARGHKDGYGHGE